VVTEETDFLRWLAEARVSEETLTAEQRALLQTSWRFLERCGRDYYSMRLLGHLLLHCQSGLTVAAIARLLGISRAAASGQQKLSSKEVVQAAHQRLRGRAHGKLLPRFAGPIAQFLMQQPQATRWDVLDFIEATWGVRVSRMALHKFLKKYGLDQVHDVVPLPAPQSAAEPACGSSPTPPGGEEGAALPAVSVPAQVETMPGEPVPLPPRNFFSPPPTTPGRSCCCPTPSTGSPRRNTASRTTTARCGGDC
jgi:hypothetical protein